MRRQEDAFATITVDRQSNGGYKIHVQGTNIKPLVFGSNEEEEIKDAISGAFGKRYGGVVDKALGKAKEYGSSDFQVRLPQEVAAKELQKYNEEVKKNMRKIRKQENFLGKEGEEIGLEDLPNRLFQKLTYNLGYNKQIVEVRDYDGVYMVKFELPGRRGFDIREGVFLNLSIKGMRFERDPQYGWVMIIYIEE